MVVAMVLSKDRSDSAKLRGYNIAFVVDDENVLVMVGGWLVG